MYTYEYERVYAQGFLTAKTQEYREIIEQRARDGWRYAGFIPVKQIGEGYIAEMDLIFEKELP